ncbi:hypothetical protein GGD56_000140 [Rhizobium mongolense]|uniref:Uncharacterized protein n=2 Tax=Rhizobium mongolense TaxID=57676 RepID=A0ABR6IEM8_9HYPH|nr:hypothetical protein [Rhizobium mongolense]TVZ73602.1 hypothetical protein BCL32_1846 [Rhizobium mongolense USDA 1844]
MTDPARLHVANPPGDAIFVAFDVILPAYSNYHIGLCFLVSGITVTSIFIAGDASH